MMFQGYRFYFVSFLLCSLFSISSHASDLLEGLTPIKNNTYRLFTIHGSNTVGANLGPELVKRFLEHNNVTRVQRRSGEKENEQVVKGVTYKDGNPVNVEVYVAAHGSSTGFRGIKAGNADIAASSRPIKKKEEQALLRYGDMRSISNEHIIAIDGLAIIVHPSNKLNQLSTDQLKNIFTGKITRWSQIGGANTTIRVLSRDYNSGTYDTFKGLVLKKTPLVKTARLYESNDEISQLITSDPKAIGFVALASIGHAKPLKISDGKAMSLSPNVLTVATEDYALSRRLYFYSKNIDKNNAATNAFLEFVKTDSGQNVVDESGFIAQSLFPLKTSEDTNWKRLNMNIRFQGGSSSLDNKATIDVQRLVDYINLPENQYMQVKLVGYSNPESTDRKPSSVSRLRAQSVRWALRTNGLSNKIKTDSGNLMSVADPKSINSDKNRRVEVWVQ